MTIEEIRRLCHQLVQRLIADDDARRLELREAHRPVFADRFGVEDHNGDVREADRAALADDAEFWRTVSAEGDFDAVSETVEELLEGRHATDLERRQLSQGVIEAFIKAREVSEGRTTGRAYTILGLEPGPTVPAEFGGAQRAQIEVIAAPATQNTPLASELAKDFLVSAELNRIRGQTVAQGDASLRLFIKAVGDRPVHTYGGQDGQDYWNILRQLPSDHHKLGRGDEERTIQEVIERGARQGMSTLTRRTLQRHKNTLEAFMAYAHGLDLVPEKLLRITAGWRIPKREIADHGERDDWKPEDLQVLFNCPIWRGSKSEKRQTTPGPTVFRNWKFWIPLLSLYEGARLEEICQLRREDIRKEAERSPARPRQCLEPFSRLTWSSFSPPNSVRQR